MNSKITYRKKTYLLLYVFSGLFSFLLIESFYLSSQKSSTLLKIEKKLAFIKLSGIPDLAIATETTYIRHRSLATISSIYKEDGTLREYFPTTYAISHSHKMEKYN